MKRTLSMLLAIALMALLMPKFSAPVSAATRWDVKNTGNVTGQDIVDKAREFTGCARTDSTNYKIRTGFGTPMAFDCSGFVYRVLREVDLGSTQPNATMGIYDANGNAFEGKNSAGYYYITAHTHNQKYYGERLTTAVSDYKNYKDYSGFRPGDLMFFDYDGDNVTNHVGIYTGNGTVIHSTSSSGIRETKLSQTGWPNGTLGSSLYDATRLVDTVACDTHSYNDLGECTSCGAAYDYAPSYTTANEGYYTVSATVGIQLRTKIPYYASTYKTSLISFGTEVEVIGTLTNALGELWHHVSYNGQTGYTRAQYLEWVGYGDQVITCDLTSPEEEASVPKASYPVKGTVTSKYPLKKVEAYIDGSLYVTVDLGTARTLDIQSSDINNKLSFAKLSVGDHTLIIKAHDIYHDEILTVCTRNFVTVCSHSYTSTVTHTPSCTVEGVMTYTCSSCGDSYTEAIAATGHEYEDGICVDCGSFEHGSSLRGDLNNDSVVDNLDVEYLLWHTLFPASYPATQDADYNTDGVVDNLDVEHLLWHTLLPDSYPI